MADVFNVPARGATNFTFQIVELFDTRLGQKVFEVHAKNQDTGNSWLIAECNTRAAARDVIRRRQEVSDD
jgi:hypothetical protein